MTTNQIDLATGIFAQLQKSWNSADGNAFGERFADETDFVDIRGTHHRGDGAAVGQAHQGILDSIYQGSTVQYNVTDARELATECVLAHATATLEAPVGPLAGTNTSVISAVIVGIGDGARITSFHNTLVVG